MMHYDADGANWEEYRRTLRHDMRTPVNHILSYADLVSEDAADRGMTGLVAEMGLIQEAGRTSLKLVSSFLETRPDPDSVGPNATQIELAELMRNVASRIARVRRSRAVQAAPEIGADLERIEAAAQHLLALAVRQ